jgi:hypothetical protein
MEWVVEQRDPSGRWSIVRCTCTDQEDAEYRARYLKQHVPHLRFRYRAVDDDGDEIAGIEPIEV